MPVNLNLLARTRVINDCLCHRREKYWPKEKLAEEIRELTQLPCSTRTVIADIRLMRESSLLEFYAPINYSKSPDGYHYTDPTYSIDKLPLSANDIKSLKLAASTLNQYRNVPLLSELIATIGKVVDVVEKGKIKEGSIFEFIDFERTPLASGMEFMDQLTDAIQYQQCLQLSYQKFGAKPEKFDIHPYLLKEYRNRWYVIAYNEQKKDMRTYGLDRIVSLAATSCDYNKGFAVDRDYLSDCIGINLEDQVVEDVLLKFIPSEGHYLKTQKMHRSQEIVSDDQDGLVIQLRLIVNFELIGIILGYGAKVTVIAPSHLKKQIVKISKKIHNNYPELNKPLISTDES
ncbi:helix-turn-helix transcriptional regulator [Mucilaginibacter aquariorum]|uniref:WYL domain-containing protein n=1 Tax=Mucilaginibacter aquariorum TaxID=2967225 RepID=A0ABT1T6Z7_9SPHI|nr:WYL domain-containing protein [Mucilaginibacter aquariorum]MCQ6960404.1 WYL domain-containing protein [Mucilaginibacter aquariorum]